MRIKLLPTNKRLKQLIKERGDVWEVIRERKVQCFNNIGHLIRNGNHTRWVQEKDFECFGSH